MIPEEYKNKPIKETDKCIKIYASQYERMVLTQLLAINSVTEKIDKIAIKLFRTLDTSE